MESQAVSCFCPICGHSIPQKRVVERIKSRGVEFADYFASISWDASKPFGVNRTASGKASFSDWHYINPSEAPELFDALKGRFLQALSEWVKTKKWISRAEVEKALK